jgi:hypothetical protein
MIRRLLTILIPVLVLGAGTLWAQGAAVNEYLERGRALSKAEKFEQALTYFLFALELGEKEFGADSPSVVPLLDDLAEIYAARSHYGDAEPLFERSLEIQERALSGYRSGIARTLNRLGAIYEATARPDAARQAYTRVLAELQPGLGAGDPSVQTARLRLAKLERLPPPPAIATPAIATPAIVPTPAITPTPPAPVASAPTVVAAPPAEAAPKVAAPRAEAAPKVAVGYRLHLTSVRQSGQVPEEWRRLRRIYPALLSGLEVAVARVDLGTGRGVWFRVQGGPLTRAEARRLCGAFARRGIWCAVRRGAAATPETQVAAADGYRIHLSSIRREADAAAEWLRLRRRFRTLLADLRLSVMRADLGAERGVWYRIQGGPLARAEARARCASFAVRRQWCRVVPPSGQTSEGGQRFVALRVRRRGPAGSRGTQRPRRFPAPDPGARRFSEED